MQFVMCFFPICLNYIMPNAAFKAPVIHLSILLYFYYTQYMLPKYTLKIGNFQIYESFASRFDWIIKKNRFKRIIRSRIGHHSRLITHPRCASWAGLLHTVSVGCRRFIAVFTFYMNVMSRMKETASRRIWCCWECTLERGRFDSEDVTITIRR